MTQVDLMMMKEINLAKKHILFDSCAVGELFKNEAVPSLVNLIQLLKKQECIFCINDFIKLEFLRIARNQSEYKKLEEFLEKYFLVLPYKPDLPAQPGVPARPGMPTWACELAATYNLCGVGKKQISAVDCLNGVFLLKFSKNLVLLTLDNKDYPLEVFNRLYVQAIDVEKRILVWAFYDFDVAKYEQKRKIFQKN